MAVKRQRLTRKSELGRPGQGYPGWSPVALWILLIAATIGGLILGLNK